MFVYLRNVSTRNQPQPLQENVERPFRIYQYIYNDQKAWSLDETTISKIKFQKFCNHLPLCLKAYYILLLHIVLTCTRQKRQMDISKILWSIFFYKIPSAIRMKNHIPWGSMILQDHTVKLKRGNTVNPSVPLLNLAVLKPTWKKKKIKLGVHRTSQHPPA